jgi:hypothetical protein
VGTVPGESASATAVHGSGKGRSCQAARRQPPPAATTAAGCWQECKSVLPCCFFSLIKNDYMFTLRYATEWKNSTLLLACLPRPRRRQDLFHQEHPHNAICNLHLWSQCV